MHFLCDCETIVEFCKCVIGLINVNINNESLLIFTFIRRMTHLYLSFINVNINNESLIIFTFIRPMTHLYLSFISIINNDRYKYVENDVILGCLNDNLNMKEKQIVNVFILNATWIIQKSNVE